MPDPEGNQNADEEELPDTPLHAYKEGRDEDVEGPLSEEGQLEEADDVGKIDKH
jgi:hypothetical protein